MADIKVEYDDKDFQKFLSSMRNFFPEISAQLLGFIGSRAKSILRFKFLSGQELNLKAYPKDRLGHPTISYSIGRKAKYVKISSYPLNLFEKGRKLRSGEKETGKHIMKRKFKQYMMSQIPKLTNEFDNTILKRKVEKI